LFEVVPATLKQEGKHAMETDPQEKDKKIVPDLDGILAEKDAQSEHDVPGAEDIPTSDKNLQAPLPEELAKDVAPADGYEEPAEDIAKEEHWQSTSDLPGAPTRVETQEEGGARPPVVLVDELTPAELAELFARHASIDLNVRIDDLQPIPGVPDYFTPTESELAIGLITRASRFILDGPEKSEAAKQRGETVTRYRVHFQEEVTPEELAFFKARTRTWKEGGEASWAEKVNVIAILEPIHIANNPNLYVNAHGGVRVTGQRDADGENNLINALAKGLGKRPTTIKQWRNDGQDLTGECRGQLAQALLSRSFFEDIRKPKADLILKLQGRNEPPEAITLLVSELVLSLNAVYQTNGGKFERDTIKNVVAQFSQTHFPSEMPATQTPPSGGVEPDQEIQGDASPAPAASADETGDTGDLAERKETQGPDEKSESSPDPQSESKTENNGDESPDKSSTKARPALRTLSPLEKQKAEMTGVLGILIEEFNGIADDTECVKVAYNIFAYGFRLLSGLLSPADFKKIIKKLWSKFRGQAR
jgi:hypothetical protein